MDWTWKKWNKDYQISLDKIKIKKNTQSNETHGFMVGQRVVIFNKLQKINVNFH